MTARNLRHRTSTTQSSSHQTITNHRKPAKFFIDGRSHIKQERWWWLIRATDQLCSSSSPYYWAARPRKMRCWLSRRTHGTANGPLVGQKPRNFASTSRPMPYQRFGSILIRWMSAYMSIWHHVLCFCVVASALSAISTPLGTIPRHNGPNKSFPSLRHQAIY